MIGDLFVNFTKDKVLNININDAVGGIEIGFENGNVELEIRLSEEQIARLRGVLENSTTERRSL